MDIKTDNIGNGNGAPRITIKNILISHDKKIHSLETDNERLQKEVNELHAKIDDLVSTIRSTYAIPSAPPSGENIQMNIVV